MVGIHIIFATHRCSFLTECGQSAMALASYVLTFYQTTLRPTRTTLGWSADFKLDCLANFRLKPVLHSNWTN